MIITKGSHKYNGKSCGMAEMAGLCDPDTNAPICAGVQRGVKGAILVRWLLEKDLLLTQIDDLKYHGQPIGQLRHANTLVVGSYYDGSSLLVETRSLYCW